MAQLLVRKLEDSLVAILKERASQNGRSVEQEHRLILREALTGISSSAGKMSFEEYLIADPCEDLEIPLEPREYPPENQPVG
ncbi:MAG: plasmid stabilization protein [Verrucomicrobiota bacterium]